ncbi:50S ribosomal protein L25 [Candidatus Peregrinibacteria bacterium]|nr:50S ribosomal protein L25 [Candidatus Peregrinibacteria bacterium]
MEMVKLSAQARRDKLTPRTLRAAGSVPCVVYGSEVKNLQIECPIMPLHKAFVKAGESTLIELDVAGKRIPVLIKDITFDPVSGRETHVDFYAVDMKKEIETTVPVRFEGEPIAVKELGAIFVASHDHVRVRCLPADLPHDLPVDVSGLAEFHDTVKVSALKLPKGVTVMEGPETVLATVQEPRKEEEIAPPTPTPEEAAAAAAAAGTTPEGEAPKEGAAPTAEAGAPAKDKAAGKEKK